MDFIAKLTEKLSFGKKEVEPVPFVRVPGLLDSIDKETEFQVTVSKIVKVNHDSYIYTCDLEDPNISLGLQVGHHITIRANVPTKDDPVGPLLKRSYTPISSLNQKGSFDILVKIYRANTHPQFPNGGPLTQYLENNLKVGDKLTMTGPVFKVTYLGHGKFNFKDTEYNVKEVGLIGGGTGIAPMYQLVRAVLDDPTDKTKVFLLVANKSEEDILLKDELKEAAKDPRIKITYTVDTGSSSWKGYTGYITKEMLEKSMPKAEGNPFLWGSGPKPMQRICKNFMKELGHDTDHAVLTG